MHWLWYVVLVYAFLYVILVVVMYGLFKNMERQWFIKNIALENCSIVGYGWGFEFFTILFSIIFPIGIGRIIFDRLMGCSLGFCYKMPKELCVKRK